MLWCNNGKLRESINLWISWKFIYKSNCGFYGDEGLIFEKDTNGQKRDKIRKLVIKIFIDAGFKIIKTNLKILDFLDVILSLDKETYNPYKKPNNKILYINTLTNIHHN